MISFEHVSKFVLHDINLHIPEGIIAGVIGVSGAGKTTLLRLACGLLKCEQGSVWTFYEDPVKKRGQHASEIRAFFADVPMFQEDSTILYEFQKLCADHKMKHKEFQKNYVKLAEEFGFKEYEETQIRQLSLGQRRRAELAAVLLGKSRLILLDEPTSGLDENAKNVFREWLKKKKALGTTVVLSSHDLFEEEQLCDRMILLDRGHLLYYGECERLMRQYAPIHEMELVFQGALPDMEDIPLIRYSVENDRLRVSYHSNIVSASEVISHIMEQTAVTKVNILRPKLEDVAVQIGAKRIG